MFNNKYFRQVRILDGGMGQELLSRGMDPSGTLWSAKALIEKKYHKLLEDTHKDFIKCGADVIVTNTFTTRKTRLKENGIENKFEYLNKKAGEIAEKAKKNFPDVLVAGGLPPQNNTYSPDNRSKDEVYSNYYEQAKLLNPYVDFFYLDVLSSIYEINIAIDAISEFKKSYLIGAHISDGNRLPSAEKITDIVKNKDNNKLLGLILACVSPESFEENFKELSSLKIPFGFKINGFLRTKIMNGYTEAYKKSKTGNPNEFLGKRLDLSPKNLLKIATKFKEKGATILGGCCETTPKHILEISKLK